VTGKLVLENLKHRPMRSLLSILLIGVPVTLILCLVGLTHGLQQDSQQRSRGIGADIMVRGTNAASFMGFTGATLSEKYVDLLQRQPHVKLAMGVITHPLELPLTAMGMDMAKFKAMSGGFVWVAGGPFQKPDDIIIDRYYAAQRKVGVGDTITVMDKKWHVCGVVESGKMARIVVPVDVLQNLDSARGKFSQIYLKLDDPANTGAVIAQLKELLGPDYPVWSMQEWISQITPDRIPGVREFTIVVMGIGVVIGFAVVCLSMYMAVLQRTREIGILKSLGASKVFILRIILTEALILGVGGTALGILMSYGARALIVKIIPASLPMVIVYEWWPIALAITLVAAGFGALYPGVSAARHDPIEALAYE
jgi:putative ABC transport system permease protein